MQRWRGSVVVSSRSDESQAILLSSTLKGGVLGSEPVAMMMLGAVNVSPEVVCTVFASMKAASSFTSVMPGCESKVSTPLRNASITWSLRSTTRLKSKS